MDRMMTDENITIKQFKQRRLQMEQEIFRVVQDSINSFCEDTGLYVEGVNICLDDLYELGKPKRSVVINVLCDVEI